MNTDLLGAQNNAWHIVCAIQMFVLKTHIFQPYLVWLYPLSSPTWSSSCLHHVNKWQLHHIVAYTWQSSVVYWVIVLNHHSFPVG